MSTTRHLIALLAVLLTPTLQGATRAEDEAWLNDDTEVDSAQVNEGHLVFLHTPIDSKAHHHHNHIIVHPSSLDDGWVTLTQCHDNIDPVALAQVVYNKQHTRNLSIVSYTGIEKAWVEGASVQLKNVGQTSTLCVRAQSRALVGNEDGSYSLRNGPFMRRFLDGYYPMRVSMLIELPQDKLRFSKIEPQGQPGFKVWQDTQGVHYEAWFEGRLRTDVRFLPVH